MGWLFFGNRRSYPGAIDDGVGRAEPFKTQEELEATPCQCCGRPSTASWTLYHDSSYAKHVARHVATCDDCDCAQNELSLAYLRVPDRHELMAAYRKRKT